MSSANLIANGNFATGNFTDWTLGGNYTSTNGAEILIETNPEGASTYAATLDSSGSDGTLSQTIATTAGQTYTVSFWLEMQDGGANNFSVLWDGQTLLALTDVVNSFGYTEYTFVVTATSSTSTLEFSAAGSPWFVDNVSLTETVPAPPVISGGAENSNQSVTLTGTAPDGATVTVWDGSTALGTALATSTGAWSFTIADVSAGSYAFTATDQTTSTASSPFDITVTAAPAISTGVENSNQSVTLTGTAPDGATVTVYELTTSTGATTALGTATATSTGAWSFTTSALSAGVYDFTTTQTTSAGTSAASSPFVVGVSATNPDPVTYYVSSEIGNNNNAGTSESAPLATLQAAADLVQPGDIVEVMNGTYAAVDITTSGTASAPITFEAAPGQTPVINSAGSWNGIDIQASYIIVDGFTVVGDAAEYTLASATAGYTTGNPSLDGNGIGINPSSSVPLPNNITIENNTVYDEPGGGIYTEGADYVQILNNVVYGNANWSAYGNSGISVSTSANLNTNAGVHILVSGNLVFGNADLVPTYTTATITDGEGIILDTNPNFVSEILVQNNTVYDNGSSGIESNATPNAVITENTIYLNDVGNVQAASNAEIFLNNASTDTVTTNSTTAPELTPPAAPVISSDTVNGIAGPVTVTLNGTAEAYSTVTVYDNSTQLGTTFTNGSGAWTLTTAPLADGSESFTATATDSAGNVSPLSSPLVMNLNVPVNLVANGNFATGDFTDWTLGGNYTNANGAEILIETNAQGVSTYAATLDSSGSDGTLSQTIATTAGQTYTVSFWLEMQDGGANNFSALWNGQAVLALTNVLNSFGYTEYTYTVTATSSTSTLEFSAAGSPWFLDNVSVTQNGTSAPVVNSIAESPSSGDLDAGKTVTLTLNLSEVVTVAGGTPTLTLNDGGTATYTGGSGTSALTFSYTVAAGQSTSGLTATAVTLNGATIDDGSGNAASFSLTGLTQTGPQIDTITPTITSIAESPSSGDLNAGKVVTITLDMSEVVTVNTSGGTPTLTLNDGGTATYTGGSGTNALTFSYTVAAGQNTPDLMETAVNLNGATITDGAGNAANLSLAGLPQGSPEIDTTTPTVSSVTESPASGVLDAGKTVTLTLNLNEAVTVAGGTPTLTLNDGGTATYTGGSGTSALTFSYTVAAGQNTSGLTATAVNLNSATISDGAGNVANLSLSGLTQTGPQIDTTTPTVSSVVASGTGISGGTGDLDAGKTITLTLNLSEAVTVAGGTPTLTLNDGGTATYTGGSGTSALTFSYTVAAGQNTPDLTVTAVNLNSATVTDGAGNAANLSGAVTNPAGTLQIDTTTPTISSLTESPSSGDLDAGKTVTLTLTLNEAVTVAGGTPTLTLNDGGTATYTGGSGTDALTFSYTVAAGQNTSGLTATAVNLNSATITDGAGNAASFSLTGLTQTGPQIDTTTPTVSSVMASGTGISGGTGDLDAGKTVTLTLTLNEAVTVAGGTPTLTLNDGGTATYTGGSGTSALTFSYTVAAGQNTPDLTVTAVNLNSATVTDGAGNAANLSGAVTNPAGTLQIDTTTPTISSLTESPSSGDLDAGKTVTLTLNLSEAVTVAGGTPTLTLNDGGTATYTGGSGTNALTFSYTVAAGQSTSSLAATAVNLNSATIKDGAGNAANLSLSGLTQTGPQIDTTAPTISSLTESPLSGDLDAGKTVTLTLTLNEAVTVAGGTPTLTLNDGGTATYTGGSGTSALTFSYTVAAGQSTSALTATAVNLNSATISDGAGNVANLSLSGLTQTGPQIDTTTPTVSSVVASGTGISGGTGDLDAGKTVTLTLTLNEAVTISGGTPTLTLNDGGTATYTGGSGTSALTFSYTVAAGQNTPDLTVTAVNLNSATVTDGAGNAANLSGAVTNPAGTLQIDTTTPTISSLTESPSSGDLDAGKTVTLTLNLNEAVTVAGGTPTLTLNDGGTATYTGGSGTSALTFSYTVAAGQSTSALTATAVNLNSATISDGAGNVTNLSLSGLTQTGPQIDTTTPTVSSVVASGTGISGGTGDLDAGKSVTLTLTLSEAVTVAGGTPTLTLNDGGTATYTGGSGTSALTFSYTVAAGQNTPDLTVTAVNLNSATVTDGAGNAANLSGAVTNPAGTLQIDTTTPTISSLTESPSSGDLDAGKSVTLTLNLNEAVTVAGGTPTLTLNDGGTATYTGGSGTDALTFSYTVAAGQSTSGLTATAVNLNSATIKDGAGNAASLSLSGLTQTGPQIDTTTPTVSSVVASGTGISSGTGDLDAGKTVTLTLNLNEAVTVAGGTPTLTLNDGGTATYTGGSGTSALTFSYTVAAGQNTPDLTVTAVNLNSATVTDGAGNAANLSGAVTNPAGTLQIDTTTPTISSLTESPASGVLDAGKTVTLTLNLNEAVTVAGGTPTLTLNDGGTATYTGGSGTSALTFSYTVAAGQNTSGLTATAVNLNSATITDGAGNAASLSLSGLTQTGPQIDTTTPTVSSVVASGTGISSGTGDLDAGKTVTLTLTLNEAVTVAGGTPTLTLNDGGTATYTGGSGTSALTFSYTVAAGQNTPDLTVTAVNLNSATVTDGAGNAANLSGAVTNPAGTLQIDTTTPTISSLTESPASGDLDAGKTVTLTLNLSEAVTVAGGTPTLTLNDGGTATYTGGSGTSALTFSYTVAAGQSTSGLTATAVNLNSATIKDGAGNAASLSLSGLTQTGPQIDTTTPTITSIGESPSSGDLNAGKVVTITLDMSEVVTVNTSGGTPTLTLNDGGTATYTGGSGTSALTFSYTVAAGQNTPDLMETAVNLNGATITDGAGNAANLSLAGLPQGSPQIDTTTPTVSSITESPASGVLDAGKTVTLTLNLNEAVTVAGGTPTLTLNDGGTATYTGGSGTSALTFSYTVAAGQNTPDLTVTAVNLNSATVTDGAGNAANLSGAVTNPAGTLQIDTTTPTISSLTESPSSGDLDAGKTVTLTLNLNEAVTVAGGTPTLTLNDGGTATYTGGSGTSALTFSYTVAAGQSTSGLTATAVNLNSATIKDGAGNAASLSLSGLTQTGPQIDTTAPATPRISSFTPDGGTAAGGFTSAHVLTLTGTAQANSTVEVFDGSAELGTTTANGNGVWSYTTPTLSNGSQSFTAKAIDAAGNLSAASAPLTVTVITAASVSKSGQHYDISTTLSDPVLQYDGADVSAGEFAGWVPIAAVQTASGYDVAWYNTATGLYTVWATDSNGNYISNLIGDVAGNSYALESFELVFQQDLNGDGVIGPTTTVIQTDGSTTLSAVANQFTIGSGGSSVMLSYGGAAVTAGEFAGWTPIGAVQTASGYDVAWYNTATGQYTVWATDSNGNYLSNLFGSVAGNSYALESIETVFGQDLNGDGTIGLTSTPIQTDRSTTLSAVANQFSIGSGGSDPTLTYGGAAVTAGEFVGWTPIGAVQTASGYDVAWYNTATGLYTVWATDSNGNYLSNLFGAVAGNSYALESIETVFGQDLNGDGTIGLTSTPIQTDGSTTLTAVANQFTIGSGGSSVMLSYGGAAVTAGEFVGWTPIGAVQTASGYDVAWYNTATGLYTVWATDSNGNYISNLFGAVAGNSYALESIETVFGQALNGAGTIGLTSTPIYTDGSTTLTAVANQFTIGSGGSSVMLSYGGAAVTAGEFGNWTPIAAVQTTTGYDIAWEIPGTNEYTVWSINSSGAYISNLVGTDTATNPALEAIEPVFEQYQNSDGLFGLSATAIQTDGSTSLTQVGNEYYLYGSSGSGPALSYGGSAVTAGEFAGWTPIGAVQTASGYDIAWENADGQYTVWATDRNGNYISNLIGAVAGNSTALEELEPIFGQALNGDGVIGLYAAPNTTLQISSALSGATGAATIGAGATLDLAAADSAAVTFAASTGELVLANPSAFTGEIYGFTGNGTLSGSDQIDLKGVNYNGLEDSYSNGVLTISSGGETVELDFNGSYALANFSFASDGSGGTIVYDPPVDESDASTAPASAKWWRSGWYRPMPRASSAPNNGGSNQADSGSHAANLALFSSYIGSSFPAGSGTTNASASAHDWQNMHQSLLTHPHH